MNSAKTIFCHLNTSCEEYPAVFKDENLLPSMIYQVQHHTRINNQCWLFSSACAVEVFIARTVQIVVKSLQTHVPPIH